MEMSWSSSMILFYHVPQRVDCNALPKPAILNLFGSRIPQIPNYATNSKWAPFHLNYDLYNKRVRPTKNEPQQRISYLEREREGVRESQGREGGEREGGGRVSRSAGRNI